MLLSLALAAFTLIKLEVEWAFERHECPLRLGTPCILGYRSDCSRSSWEEALLAPLDLVESHCSMASFLALLIWLDRRSRPVGSPVLPLAGRLCRCLKLSGLDPSFLPSAPVSNAPLGSRSRLKGRG